MQKQKGFAYHSRPPKIIQKFQSGMSNVAHPHVRLFQRRLESKKGR